jgi:hypothetical protein
MIKIFTISGLIYLMPFLGNAQFETGQKVIGGSIALSINKQESPYSYGSTNNYTNIYVSPSFAKFSKPNLLRGVGFCMFTII